MKPYQPRPNPSDHPYVIAHRGISNKAPENTLSSFSRAVSTPGVRMIELDVRISQDEQVVVLHDRTLQRTSTGNGAAHNYTLKELKEFDAGCLQSESRPLRSACDRHCAGGKDGGSGALFKLHA